MLVLGLGIRAWTLMLIMFASEGITFASVLLVAHYTETLVFSLSGCLIIIGVSLLCLVVASWGVTRRQRKNRLEGKCQAVSLKSVK